MHFTKIVITKRPLRSSIPEVTIPEGSVCVYDERMGAIEINLKHRKSSVWIRVKDNGKDYKELEWVDVKTTN
jgi:hypothetical protein